jgi:hypothetical protein
MVTITASRIRAAWMMYLFNFSTEAAHLTRGKEKNMSIPLTVENLYSGGVVERIHEELKRVLENIVDPNTPAKKPRKVKMEMTIKPTEARNMAEVLVSTSSTLQAPEPLETTIFIAHKLLF